MLTQAVDAKLIAAASHLGCRMPQDSAVPMAHVIFFRMGKQGPGNPL